ncbi:MAG: DUF5335 domain-containing protein [Methylococcaceae bacterium]|nr:DUF5335 domain-containing protein [Methylococcaceae bacterium]
MAKHSEIAKIQWQSFCDNYTRQHRGWVVKVDAYDPALAKLFCQAPPPRLKTIANNLAFQGIVFEDSGFRLELLICLASGGELFTHRVMQPTIIVALWTDVGSDEGIIIHDKTGGLIHMRFRKPASPELLDDWMGLESRNRKHVFRLSAGAL